MPALIYPITDDQIEAEYLEWMAEGDANEYEWWCAVNREPIEEEYAIEMCP